MEGKDGMKQESTPSTLLPSLDWIIPPVQILSLDLTSSIIGQN